MSLNASKLLASYFMLVVSGGVNLGSELGSCVSGRKSRPQNKTLTGT